MPGSFTLEEWVRLALTSTKRSAMCPRSSFILSTMKPSLTMMSPWWSSAATSLSPATSVPSVWQINPASSIPPLPAGQQAGPNIIKVVSNFWPDPLVEKCKEIHLLAFLYKPTISSHNDFSILEINTGVKRSHIKSCFCAVTFLQLKKQTNNICFSVSLWKHSTIWRFFILRIKSVNWDQRSFLQVSCQTLQYCSRLVSLSWETSSVFAATWDRIDPSLTKWFV